MEPHPSQPPTPVGTRRAGLSASAFAGLLVAALLGGGAALGGAAAVGAFDGSSTTVVDAAPAGDAVPIGSTTGLSINQIYKRSGPGVVQITSTTRATTQTDSFGKQSQTPAEQALGSGFVLDKQGHIVTNYHVIEDASTIEVRFSNDDTLRATLVGSDPSTDIALLKVGASARALTPLALADSDRIEVGDPVVAIGNPFGLERTVTAGIVSAVQRAVSAPNGYAIDHVIQTDAPINHGNSGGPLLNGRGDVIGVNSQIETGGSGDGNVGIGFAVPSNTVKSTVAQLLKTGKVEHAYLGVYAVAVTPAVSRSFRLPVDAGLAVQQVTPGSGAAKAGMKGGTKQVVIAGESFRMGGDVIVSANGKAVTSIDALRDVVASHMPGDKLALKIYRGQQAQTVTVTLGRQPPGTTSP